MTGRLSTRPLLPAARGAPGVHRLPAGAGRAPLLFVPASYSDNAAWPLVVSLHGAGGVPDRGLSLLQALADKERFLVLAPASHRQTWDLIVDSFGPDVQALDSALQWTFERYCVKPDVLAIGGFSDGASYALSVGVINGDLFTHVLAFSPGFLRALKPHGRPKIYVSHGTGDRVLPIDACSRRIVPQLKRAGYDVTYKEFEGGHTVPEEQRREAVNLFMGRK